jgi:hypothetical protein
MVVVHAIQNVSRMGAVRLLAHDQHPDIDNLNGKCILAYLEKSFHFVLMFSFASYWLG